MTSRVELSKSDFKDPNFWATVHQTHLDWLRQVSPQLHIDGFRAVMGDALGSIYGDDPNCFGFYFMSPEISELGKQHLRIRMGIALNTPELPEVIRNQIQTIAPQVFSFDWSSREGYIKARKLWTKKIKNFTQHQIALHVEFRDAVRYYHSIAERLSPFWQAFLDSKKP